MNRNIDYLIISVLKQGARISAVVADHIDDARLAAAGPQCLVLAEVHPIGGSSHATAHQLALHIVPGGQIVGAGAYDRLFE